MILTVDCFNAYNYKTTVIGKHGQDRVSFYFDFSDDGKTDASLIRR